MKINEVISSKTQGVTEAQSAKTGIYQTDVLGAKAYHARCMEPNCDWESKRFDKIRQAQAAAEKHAKGHFEQGVAEGDYGIPNIPQFASFYNKKGQLVGTSDHNGFHFTDEYYQSLAQEFQKAQIDQMASKYNVAQKLKSGAWVAKQGVAENFADGKVKGKSRSGRVKRAGASCAGSVTDLRARAKKYGGERGRMYHWCANMKSGRSKTNESADTIYYHGGNTAITQPRVPAHGMYFSPHREWAKEYGPVITQAHVINPRIYLVDYDEDIDDDILDALFDRDYAKVSEYIKMLAQQGYTALQTVTDSEMLVVFPGSRIEIIGVEK